MRIRAFLCRLVFCLSLFLPTNSVLGASGEDDWQQIEPGIDYLEFLLDGPNRVFVARMDRSQENVVLDTSIAQGRLAYGGEKVSGMAARYDEAVNFWEFPSGSRNHVAVAINGSFVNSGTSIPYSGVVQSGWYAKRYENSTGVAFGWKYDAIVGNRKAFIEDCVSNPDHKQYVLNLRNADQYIINGINIPRPSNKMILYTPHYDTTTRTANDGVEVLVEMRRPNVLISGSNQAKGKVIDIRNAGWTPIPFDHVVLSAHGEAADRLLGSVQINDEIEISQEITNCTPSESNWIKTYAGITGDHTYLKSGMVIPHPNPDTNRAVHPRTAIAFNDQYIFFIVVDGRQASISVGMTYVQLGNFSVNYLQAHTGMALDGGGSSTMVINGKVMNNPSDRCFTMYLPALTASNRLSSTGEQLMEVMVLESMEASLPSTVCERPVGSGLMMIVLQPNQPSSSYQPGFSVLTLGDAQVRLGPGTNYALMATITQGQEGVILPHINSLNGVYAKGKHWWKVDFGSIEGWVSEDSLMRKPSTGIPN
jgi:hypothetical protein